MEKIPSPLPENPSGPERPGLFERWLKRRRKETALEAGAEPAPKPRRLALEALRGIGLERPPEPPPRREEATEAKEEVPEIHETAKTARRLGRITLDFVRGLLGRETAAPPTEAVGEAPVMVLQSAETDLGGALEELDSAIETRPAVETKIPEAAPASSIAEGGDPSPKPETPVAEAPANFNLAARAAEVGQLLEAREKIQKALVVAGVGVVAVGVTVALALEARWAARERRQMAKERKKDRRLREAQAAQLREQQEALKYLQAAQLPAAPERPAFYQQVGEFTHRQADVTREVAREVRQYNAGQQEAASPNIPAPRSSPEANPPEKPAVPKWQSPEFAVPAPQQSERPLARVETAEQTEHQPGSNPRSLQSAGSQWPSGPGGAPPANGYETPVPGSPAAPQTPAQIQRLAAEAARRQKTAQFAWIAGIGLAAAVLALVLVYAFVV